MKAPYRLKPYNDSTRPHLKFVVNFKEKDEATGTVKRARRFFETKTDAKTFMEKENIRHLNQGKEGAEFPTWLRVMASECTDLLKPFGKTIKDATIHYVKFLNATSKSRLVPDVVKELLEDRSKLSERYVGDLENRLGRFAAAFPDALIAAVSKDQISDWLSALKVGDTTYDNFRRLLIVLFNFAIEKGYAPENPVVKIKPKGDGNDEAPGILTVEQTRDLLNAAPDDLVPYFAIGALAGLRPSELDRLEWSSIHFDEGVIEVQGRKGGKKRGAKIRFVTIQPNLMEWITPHRGSVGPIAPQTNLRKRIEAARKAAGITEWPHDCLRHGFASYHLAHFADKNALILQMGHTGDDMIFNHYRALVRKPEAAKYWQIKPAPTDGKIVSMQAA